jgi:hypothetical protein
MTEQQSLEVDKMATEVTDLVKQIESLPETSFRRCTQYARAIKVLIGEKRDVYTVAMHALAFIRAGANREGVMWAWSTFQ